MSDATPELSPHLTPPDKRSGEEPGLLHRISDGLWRANTFTVTLLAIVLAVIVGGILIIISDTEVLATYSYFFSRPNDAITASWELVSDAYANMLKGAIVDPDAVSEWLNGSKSWTLVFYPISETLTYATPLIFTGLSVALAFRGGLFNIGAQGQAILGAMFAASIGFALHLPIGLHLLVAILGGLLGGLIWGFIPGFLKARTGAHEVITTIMLNYVAQLLLNWYIVQDGIQSPTRSDAISKELDSSAKLPHLLGDSLRLDAGILLGLLTAWAISWLLNRSTLGFEIRAVGSNPSAARTAGMSVVRVTVIVMALAGALAGLGGATSVIGSQANALTGSVVGQVGFNGILVALLGRVKPWGVVLGALLYGALQAGGNRMQSYAGISQELVFVLQALIVLFVATPALIRSIFRLRAARGGRTETTMARGW